MSIKGKTIILRILILSKRNDIISSTGLRGKVLIQKERYFISVGKKILTHDGFWKKKRIGKLLQCHQTRRTNMFHISQAQSAAFYNGQKHEDDWKTIAFLTWVAEGINEVNSQFWQRVLETINTVDCKML